MSTRRVRLGDTGGGVMGLKCSLPGFDVVTGGDITNSFDSSWTDFAVLHQIGTVSLVTVPGSVSVSYPDPGYIPFVEVRWYSSTTIYDDINSSGVGTSYGTVTRIFNTSVQIFGSAAATFLYAVYKIQVPTG